MKHALRLSIAAAVAATFAVGILRAEKPHSSHGHAPSTPAAAAPVPAAKAPAPTADEALATLKAGNVRFVNGTASHPHADAARRTQTATDGQAPIVSLLTCSDSRVPAEVLFDAGVGDLFVVRVAGNIACTTEIGTLEYGAGHLNTPLIVVMGHTKCGAVTAAVKNADVHGRIPSLIEHIKPAVETVKVDSPGLSEAKFVSAVIRANVNQAIKETLLRSQELRTLAGEGKVKLVGAVYDIETGKVEWTGEHPQLSALLGEPAAGELVEDAADHTQPARPERDVAAAH